MRMYNPEWDAVKDMKFTPKVLDLYYDLSGGEIPADHGPALYAEVLRHLPWLADTPVAGIHPVHGAPSGRNANLVINRRVKLVLRLPVERLEAAHALVGQSINPGAGNLVIGPLKEKNLTPFGTLYSHFVTLGDADEAMILVEVRRKLDELGIQCGLIPGLQRKMLTPEGEISGHTLMLHDLSMVHSLAVQESGLGLHRAWGCGIFIPHKSIKEVSTV
ncbi:MAG: type I-MYXAN CRISPR-associated protein Cas6/Cmx6 [Gallionellaceae bacterium]|nr:type I-MYXAN CRISPR-associated protein Cas6/Cmx6 [Gallionellaceae bacterium]